MRIGITCRRSAIKFLHSLRPRHIIFADETDLWLSRELPDRRNAHMDGTVLHFDPQTDKGFIRASDGKRYAFSRGQWASNDTVHAGDMVDFEPVDATATEIFVVKKAAGTTTVSTIAGIASQIRQQVGAGAAAIPAGQNPAAYFFTHKPATIAAALILLASVLPFISLPPLPIGGFEGGGVNLYSTVMKVSQAIGFLGAFAPASISVPLRLVYLLLLIPASASYLLYAEAMAKSDDRLRARVGLLALAGPIGIPIATAIITLVLSGGGSQLGGMINGMGSGASVISGFFGFGLMLTMASGLTLIAAVKGWSPIKALVGSFLYLFILGISLDVSIWVAMVVAVGGGFALMKVLQGWNPLASAVADEIPGGAAAGPHAVPAIPAAVAPPTVAPGNFCAECGAANEMEARFCRECGTVVQG